MTRKIIVLFTGLALCLSIAIATQWRCDIPLETLRPTYTDASSQFLDFEGMPLHYKDEGSGPPLVLIHGTGSSLHTWDGWCEELVSQFRVVRLDLPGYGLTGPHPDGDYRVDWYVDFLARWMDAMQIPRCHLAGNSLGGHIAWRFALRYPDRVDKLVLIDASGYPGPVPMIFKLMRTPVIGRILVRCTPNWLYRRQLEQVYADDQKITPELVRRYAHLIRREGNRDAMFRRFHSDHTLIYERIEEIRHPTLILWGAKDTWVPPAHGKRFQRDLDNGHLILYPNLGHVPMEEDPSQTVKDMLEFLQR